MPKKFLDLRAGMSQAARERSCALAKVMLAEMQINEVHQARGLSKKYRMMFFMSENPPQKINE